MTNIIREGNIIKVECKSEEEAINLFRNFTKFLNTPLAKRFLKKGVKHEK